MEKKSIFKFELYVSEGDSGYRMILFSENEKVVLAKAKKVVSAQDFRIQSVEEIQTEGQ